MSVNQPPGQGPSPEWDDPPTSQFEPVSPGYGPVPQQKGISAGLIVALVLVSVLFLGVLIAGAIIVAPRFTGAVGPSTTSTVPATVTIAPSAPAEEENPPTVRPATPDDAVRPAQGVRPAGAYECMDNATGPYSAVAVGTSATSCEFAQMVWLEYTDAGGRGQSMTVTAYSPVTGQRYSMSCSGGPVVTCSGGNNAVVHIY